MSSYVPPYRPAVSDISFRVRDGLKLFARRYHSTRSGDRRPVLCLAGLTRNGRDFHELAVHLSSGVENARDVYTLDYRGRGQSAWDEDWKNYTVPTEALDVLDFMTSAGLHDTTIIGTSRGGLIAMVMAAIQPTSLGPVVLNDIGPVLETDGIMRIAAYVGLIPLPRDWDEAADIVKSSNRRQFPGIADDEWAMIARQLYNEKDGKPASGYDPKLQNALSVLDGPMPELWAQFESLKRVPVLVLRGERSDILSEATVLEMHRRHPMVRSHVVSGQGHAPLLRDAPTMGEIVQFLEDTDTNAWKKTEAFAPVAAAVASAKPLHEDTHHGTHSAAANDDGPSGVMNTILSGRTAG